ncbi:MAG: ABC transporter ATP-binding protein, partial [Eubacteriales bacterium]
LTVGLVFLLSLLNRYISSLLTKATSEIYRSEYWLYSQKAMEMAYESIEDRSVSILKERIRTESQTGYNRFYLYRSVGDFVDGLTKIAASVAMTFSFFLIGAIPWYLKAALLILMTLTIVCDVITTAKVQKIENRFWDSCVDMNMLSEKYDGYVNDYSAGKDIRLYLMGDDLAERMAKLDGQFYEMGIKNANKQTLLSLPSAFLSEFLKFTTYLVLIYAALQGVVSVGSIAKYVSCMMMLLGAVSGMVRTIQLVLSNNVYMKRYFSYFDIPNNMYKGSLTVEKRDDREYYVEFRDVSFKYPNTDAYALRHVSVKFRVGEKLAVVGMNGSGKTTFIKLMCRLYDPTEGEILLNGVNIQKYDYDEYMSIFSVVFQDFCLFAFSLGQNVAASERYDRGRAEECLREAGFGDRLQTLPNGVETYLYKDYSDDGIEISGGEAQKIALARALYKNAPFIILDEPTAALDPVAEYEVYRRFNEIVGDRTAIYISHRLASCRFCDTIVVFDHGTIVQHGSHADLLADESGKYHELWYAQAQYYCEEEGGEKPL